MPTDASPLAFDDVAILVAAAGRGARAGGGVPKQYQRIAGQPLLAWTLRHLAAAAPGAALVAVIGADDAEQFDLVTDFLPPDVRERLIGPAPGAATRQASVCAGLAYLAQLQKPPAIVLIHDGARPFVSPALAQAAVAAARRARAAVPVLPLSDTIKSVDAAGMVAATLDRAPLRAAQTPQAFDFTLIREAHTRAEAQGVLDLTDDAAVAEWAGHAVATFPGDPDNMKVTLPEDFARAEARLLIERPDVRIGQGFDVHAFDDGDHIWLGGVRIPFTRSLAGHSDADVLSHAVTDALLGAIAAGDIGSHFPPSDARWKGAPSDIFLRHAADLVRARGGVIAHVDATVICEAPKVGPHRDAIRAGLAATLDIDIGRVAVKATTTERLGFTGRREGVAAMATATVRLPFDRSEA